MSWHKDCSLIVTNWSSFMKSSQQVNVTNFEVTYFSLLAEWLVRFFAVGLILLATPVCIFNYLTSIVKYSLPLNSVTTYDLLGKPYSYPAFNHGFVRHLLILSLIVKGEMAWVGLPRDLSNLTSRTDFKNMKVGLVSLYGLHQLTGISISSVEDDTHLQDEYTLADKLCLLMRVLIASLVFRTKNLNETSSFKLFGIRIDNVTLECAVTKMVTHSAKKQIQTMCFVNVNSLNLAHDNARFSQDINDCDYVFADGSGVRIAAQKKGHRLVGNINGTDLLPVLCQRALAKSQSIFLLGSEFGVASLTASNLQRQYPGLRISGTHHGYFDKHNSHDVIREINDAKTDILLVAFGSPDQEAWLQEHKTMLEVNTAIAVGGLFDFYSGRILRAPVWIRELGMEWLWRLAQEPRKKFYRYVVGNPVFLFRCFFQS